MNDFFRVYTSTDCLGVELGGALKNVIAIAAGVSDGLGYGDNFLSVLISHCAKELRLFITTIKKDKNKIEVGENLDFEVIEFDRESNRILVSHSKTFMEDLKKEANEKRKEKSAVDKKVKKTSFCLCNIIYFCIILDCIVTVILIIKFIY